jgi:ADP-ribosylation factor-like protein 8
MFRLLESKPLQSVPILILTNKIDVVPHLNESDIIQGMNLDYIVDNSWNIIPISAKEGTNMNQVMDWLIKTSKTVSKK